MKRLLTFVLLTVWVLLLIMLVQEFAFRYRPGDAYTDVIACLAKAKALDEVERTYKLKSFESERFLNERELMLVVDWGSGDTAMTCIIKDDKLWFIVHPDKGPFFPQRQ